MIRHLFVHRTRHEPTVFCGREVGNKSRFNSRQHQRRHFSARARDVPAIRRARVAVDGAAN